MKVAKVIIIVWTLVCFVSCIAGMQKVSNTMDMNNTAVQAGAGIGFMLWIFLWGLITIPTALLGVLFRKTNKSEPTERASVRGVYHNLMNCAECGHLVARTAPKCPGCGAVPIG
jgi:hypothetical protein